MSRKAGNLLPRWAFTLSASLGSSCEPSGRVRFLPSSRKLNPSVRRVNSSLPRFLKPKCSPQQVSNPRPEDNDFAQRLYADLQAKNVRCWKFDENAKWGEPIWCEIEAAIRKNDKLVVICS